MVAVGPGFRHTWSMSSNSPDLFDAALNLPDVERANLAYQLLQSLKPPATICEEEGEFEEELERRVADYDAGRTMASDWDEVAARLQRALRERPSS